MTKTSITEPRLQVFHLDNMFWGDCDRENKDLKMYSSLSNWEYSTYIQLHLDYQKRGKVSRKILSLIIYKKVKRTNYFNYVYENEWKMKRKNTELKRYFVSVYTRMREE